MIPYSDTAGATTVFLMQAVQDSAHGGNDRSVHIVATFRPIATAQSAQKTKVLLNTWNINNTDNANHYYSTISRDAIDTTKQLVWTVTDSTGNYNISHTDGMKIPLGRLNFPNIINDNEGATIAIDSVGGADKIWVAISELNTIDLPLIASSEAFNSAAHFWPDPSASSFVIPAGQLKNFKNKNCIANISFFKHKYVTISGRQYLFVREFTFNKNIQVQ